MKATLVFRMGTTIDVTSMELDELTKYQKPSAGCPVWSFWSGEHESIHFSQDCVMSVLVKDE